MIRTTHARRLAAGLMLGCLGLSTPVLAQQGSELKNPVGSYMQYPMDSGIQDNISTIPAVVWSEAIHVEDAAWLRVYLADYNLPGGSIVRFMSALDGEVQELDASGLSMWSDSSAYFNGDTVWVEIVAAPGTINNRIIVDKIAFEEEHAVVETFCGICGGSDNRTPSTENYAGRLMPIGCSATVWNDESCVVSAGHCVTSGLVMQFNVPPSTSGCNTQNPPVNDQFPITTHSSRNAGVGADWAVMTAGTNGLGEKPYDRYGLFRPIRTTNVNVGTAIDIFGYGVSKTCTRTQTQQLSEGSVTFASGTWYEYNADVTGGNSGSSIIVDGEIVGIVTHCSTGCPNYGTKVTNGDFANARDEVCGLPEFLEITNLVPGLAGQVNSFEIFDAEPGATVTMVWSLGTGSTQVSGCPDLFLDLGNPRTGGTVVADANGEATFSQFVANAASGRRVFIQVYEQSSCRKSNMTNTRFP